MDGGNLHQYVRAVSLPIHHLLDAADLALRSAQPALEVRSKLFRHLLGSPAIIKVAVFHRPLPI
jgi:hypothetical protein